MFPRESKQSHRDHEGSFYTIQRRTGQIHLLFHLPGGGLRQGPTFTIAEYLNRNFVWRQLEGVGLPKLKLPKFVR